MKVYKLSASDGVGACYTSVVRTHTRKEKGDMPSYQKSVTDLIEQGGYLDKGYAVFIQQKKKYSNVDYRAQGDQSLFSVASEGRQNF